MIRILALALTVFAMSAPSVVAAQCAFGTDGQGNVVEKQLALDAKKASIAPTVPPAVPPAVPPWAQQQAALDLALGEAFTNTLTLTEPARIAITLTNPTAERLRVSFDDVTGAHHEVEWDSAVSSTLTREVRLATGIWTISVTAEAQTFNQQAGTVIIKARFGSLAPVTPSPPWAMPVSATIDGVYIATAIGATQKVEISSSAMTAWPRPRLTLVCDANVATPIGALQFASSVTSSAADGGVRGLGVAPAIVTETLALLAEVAIDRARAGALEALRRRLVDPFCADPATRISLRRLGLGASGELALPRTCELLQSIRLDDVLASGRPLLIALRDDLRFTIAPSVAVRLARGDDRVEQALRGAVSIMDAAIDRGGFDVLQGQLALELFTAIDRAGKAVVTTLAESLVSKLEARLKQTASAAAIVAVLVRRCAAPACTDHELRAAATALVKAVIDGGWAWRDVATATDAAMIVTGAVGDIAPLRTALDYACEARLVVAVVKRCSGGGCTAGDLSAMVSQPGTYFTPESTLPGALCWDQGRFRLPGGDLAAVHRLVVDGLALVAPVVDGQGRDRARAAVRLIAQLVARNVSPERARLVMAFVDVAVAVIDEDYGTAFGRFLSLAQAAAPSASQSHVVRKFAQLVGAVASYAVVYRDTKDSDPAAARDARKRALSTIIDSMTDRTARGDERVVSVGSNVGLGFSVRDIDQDDTSDDDDDDPWLPALRVPLGVRLEHLRKRDATGRAGLGYFFALNVIDLGQFVRRNEDDDLAKVDWADFVGIGLEAGFSHAWLGRELNLAAHATYAPSIRSETGDPDNPHRAGVWTYGVALGYYVPFIDLN